MAIYFVHIGCMMILMAVVVMTFTAMDKPSWMIYSSRSQTPDEVGFSQSIGLFKSCSSPDICYTFPRNEDCAVIKHSFCNTWRSIGFLMWISSIAYMASLVGFMFVVLGGKQKFEQGWKFLPISLMLGAASEFAGVSIMAYLSSNEKFLGGWNLGSSWIMCMLSSITSAFLATFVFISKYMFEPEGNYELISSRATFL